MSLKRISLPVFALLLVGFGMQQAQAHAHLKSQYPAAGADMTAAPQALTLNFSEGIEPGFSGLSLIGPDNAVIPTGKIKTDPANPAQIIVPIEKPLTAGSYQVQWHAVSVDGHKTQGDYRFNVK
ncbi:CopC domain-containing protein YobA [Sodalis sp. dw_96]|uniref:CopC domain-containing protein YobA n=1 Tax=Sodalis sp. dw_96 TaxID=2719794 RepID=UPI001BD52E22|nr:CopC domain-containing protein YobA [Sodalis sp. dw_96]